MKLQVNINVLKPLNDEELNIRFTEAVFRIVKKKVSPCYIESLMNALNDENNLKDSTSRGDNHEKSSYL